MLFVRTCTQPDRSAGRALYAGIGRRYLGRRLMSESWLSFAQGSWPYPWVPVCGAVASVVMTAPFLRRSAVGRRPRFVVVLCLAGIGVAGYELTELVAVAWAMHEQALLGWSLRGRSAAAAAAIDAVLCLVGAWGLWRLRSWGRTFAMVYLGYVLISFLLWGARGLTSGGDQLLWIVLCQMIVLPFVTFSLMYLHGGARYFGVEPKRVAKKTDWLY